MKFLDQVKIYVKAGDGGNGGSVILRSERSLNTLIDYRFQQHHKAERGENGSGQNCTGRGGKNLLNMEDLMVEMEVREVPYF